MATGVESIHHHHHNEHSSGFQKCQLPEFITNLFRKRDGALPETLRMKWNTQKYAEVETGITRNEVAEAVDALRGFRTLSDEEKQTISRGDRGKETLGFKETNTENDVNEKALGKEPEHKAYFHYHPSIEEEFAEAIEHAGGKAKNLIEHLRALWIKTEALAYETVLRIAEENNGDPAYVGFVERFFPDGLTQGKPGLKYPNLKLRLMLYFKVDGEKLSANNHYDAGSLTFAIMESLPGLQVGTREKRDTAGVLTEAEIMEEVQRPDGKALAWPGTNYKRIDPSITGTWHGVRQHTTDDIKLGEENRWVLVAFLDEYDETVPPIEETHGIDS